MLELQHVNKRYGSLNVSDDLCLKVAEGQALGVLGPNGAGKSTMFNLITGDVKADSGYILFDGQDITRLAPNKRCRLGIGRSYQIPHPFSNMTVVQRT